MEIRVFDNLTSLNESFTAYLKEILADRERITVALSGGSTPKSLFDYWAKNHKNDIDWNRVFFFWGDERCVPPTDEQSNYNMTRGHLLNHVVIPERNVFRIKGENEPAAEAERYSTLLQMEVDKTDGIPSFDLIILGMGDDGHTASIFPQEIELWKSESFCVVATHPETGQKRVSLSGKVINHAQHVVFLVTGTTKAEKVKKIIGSRKEVKSIYPAAKVKPISGNLVWFLDEEAAKLLKA
ncbi:MAG: 6-phosphogluconolactonase [Bacteroidia bacterium]|nr:6-phosphogluconolactonase [Bacteroidia bacterium]